jgi:hypothetical protein
VDARMRVSAGLEFFTRTRTPPAPNGQKKARLLAGPVVT